jgi:hypothetical protein
MAISLTCECGKKLGVKDEMAGKKVKCPGCGTVLTVPGGEGAGGGGGRAETREAPSDEPRKKESKLAAKKSNKALYIGAGVGILVLSCCCLGLAGGGAWWFFLKGVNPEKAIIGKWGFDMEAQKNDPEFKKLGPEEQKFVEGLASAMSMEFKDGGVMTVSFGGKSETGKWKSSNAKGNTITIETRQDGEGKNWEKADLTFTDNNHMKTVQKKGNKDETVYLKRL